MEVLTYKIQIRRLKEGGYMVSVPKLPGCITLGETYEDAVAMASEAIYAFVQALVRAGDYIPVDSKPQRSTRLTMVVPAPALL